MPFTTTLHFYRPTKPPTITGESLAEFLRAFDALHVAEETISLTGKVKFGEAIDQDENPSDGWVETEIEGILVDTEIDWDMKLPHPSLRAAADALSNHKRPVYRAFLNLGDATPDICRHLERVGSPENDTDLNLNSWSLEIGPVMSSSFDSEEVFVGWISVHLWGYGYLFPWRPADLVQRAGSHPSIRQVMELCRKTWPVEPTVPDQRQKNVRQQIGDLWPYPAIDLPWDWYWSISEG